MKGGDPTSNPRQKGGMHPIYWTEQTIKYEQMYEIGRADMGGYYERGVKRTDRENERRTIQLVYLSNAARAI